MTWSFFATATTIQFGDYEYTTGENVFRGGGVEWLRWDQTVELSVNDALTSYSSQGWRLATNVEMADLFNSFNIAPANFFGSDEVESYLQILPLVDAATIYDDIIAFLGTSFYENGGDSGVGELARSFSSAIYGQDSNGNGFFNGAIIQSDMTYQGTSYDNAALLFEDTFYMPDEVYEGVSVALVREVSEPESIAILGALLLMIGLKNKGIKRLR